MDLRDVAATGVAGVTKDMVERIRHLRARRYLDAIEEKRAWLLAAEFLTQTQLATEMGVSQPYVSSMLRKARADVGERPQDGFHGSSAYEIAARYHMGEIDRSTMLDELTSWSYTTAPADPAEQLVINIFGEVLRIDLNTIGPTDSFYTLGGDSLTGVLAKARVTEAFGRDVYYRDFFNADTARGLVALLRCSPPVPGVPAPQNALLDADLWRTDGHAAVAGGFADEIGRAFDDGLLTDDDYDDLVDRGADH